MRRITFHITAGLISGACLCSIATAADNYALWGPVSGVYTGESLCYVAVDDPTYGGRFGDIWHTSPHDSICDVAKIAVATGRNVVALIREDPTPGYANDIASIEVTTKHVKSPPY